MWVSLRMLEVTAPLVEAKGEAQAVKLTNKNKPIMKLIRDCPFTIPSPLKMILL
jgi:hypothetical protein